MEAISEAATWRDENDYFGEVWFVWGRIRTAEDLCGSSLILTFWKGILKKKVRLLEISAKNDWFQNLCHSAVYS